jgi:hypothetical protein
LETTRVFSPLLLPALGVVLVMQRRRLDLSVWVTSGAGGVVAAISPDGTKVLLVEPGSRADTTHFVVADPADGTVLAAAEFTTSLGPIQGMYGCDWVGDRIVVGPGAGDGDQYPYVFGFAILNYQGGSLSLERFVALRDVGGMISLTWPRFTPDGEVWFRVANVNDGWDAVCDLNGSNCRPVTLPGSPAVIVRNWSRGVAP